MNAEPTNLFADLPTHMPEELVTTLLETSGVRIERIVSHAHVSPDGFWYDQPQGEWVALLQGAARLEFQDRSVDLLPGDSLFIAAHQKHRVAWTTPDGPSVWLAVFIDEPNGPANL